MKWIATGFILTLAVFLISCSDGDVEEYKVEAKQIEIKRHIDLRAFSRGQKLYQQNCAKCHGKNAEGNQQWRKIGDDGKYPAPPLNGTAHTWHHSTSVLVKTIKDGTAKIGGNMPAWKNKLTDSDILDILTWIKAQWPDEIYAAWYKNNDEKK